MTLLSTASLLDWLTRVPCVLEVYSSTLMSGKSNIVLQTVRHRFNIYAAVLPWHYDKEMLGLASIIKDLV